MLVIQHEVDLAFKVTLAPLAKGAPCDFFIVLETS